MLSTWPPCMAICVAGLPASGRTFSEKPFLRSRPRPMMVCNSQLTVPFSSAPMVMTGTAAKAGATVSTSARAARAICLWMMSIISILPGCGQGVMARAGSQGGRC